MVCTWLYFWLSYHTFHVIYVFIYATLGSNLHDMIILISQSSGKKPTLNKRMMMRMRVSLTLSQRKKEGAFLLPQVIEKNQVGQQWKGRWGWQNAGWTWYTCYLKHKTYLVVVRYGNSHCYITSKSHRLIDRSIYRCFLMVSNWLIPSYKWTLWIECSIFCISVQVR